MDGFIADLVALLQRKAERTRAHPEERIHLAAYLFAACHALTQNYPGVEMRLPFAGYRGSDGDDLTLAYETLLALPSSLGPVDLFLSLLAVLNRIDAQFRPWTHVRDFDISTRLEGVLSGLVVFHWISGPSLLRKVRAWTAQLDDSPQEYRDSIQDALSNLTLYLTATVPFPGRGAAVRSALHEFMPNHDPALGSSGALIGDGAPFRIALCPLPAVWHTRFCILKDRQVTGFTTLRGDAIANREALASHVERVIDEAENLGDVRFLIFPELTLDDALRQTIVARLARGSSLHLVCAGSFHVWRDGAARPQNEALIFDGGRRPLWSHCKNGKFDLPARIVRAPGCFPTDPPDQIPRHALPELIELGTELRFLDCPLGRIVLVTCADALDRSPGTKPSFHAAILALRPDLVVVIAMSPRTGSFEPFFEEMLRHGIGILFVNAACACEPRRQPADAAATAAAGAAPAAADAEPADCLAFVDLGLLEVEGSPASRWRWRAGSEPEFMRCRKGSWAPLAQHSGDPGVQLLPSGALVVDLQPALAPLLKQMESDERGGAEPGPALAPV
jgi:hypothetical protein